MSAGNWQSLSDELDRWHEADATATFWWRDDDALEWTPQLEVLLGHAGTIPVALAVTPALASPELAERLRGRASVVVLQHGWRHVNHLPGGLDEYPADRPADDVSRELLEGRLLLAAQFNAQAIPVFVPPFHAFDDRFLPLLRPSGITGISKKGPRPGPFAADGVLQINAQISPIRWSDPPSFGDESIYLDAIVDHLCGRRTGRYDRAEPTGLLTHHLCLDARSYEFIARFVERVSQHPATTWLDAREMFGVQDARRHKRASSA